MAEEENLENLDDLDWSDVENELKANREQILSQADSDDDSDDNDDDEPRSRGGSASPASFSGDVDIDFLLDVMLDITVEVGRTQMVIDDLLKLDQASIIELQSSVGQPLDIRVNGKLVARGEIAVVNEKFAVRITDVVSPDDRFAAL